MNIWWGRRLRILAWYALQSINRSQQRQEPVRLAEQRTRVRALDTEVAQQKKDATPQYSAKQQQHELEKELKHFSATKHAESRRYLLPGEDYAKDALEIAKHDATPQTERLQPQLQAQNWSPHEQRIRAGLYEPEPRPATYRRRQFIKVGEVWVPIESIEQAEAQHIQAAPDVKARHEALEQPQTLPYAQQGRLYWTHFSEQERARYIQALEQPQTLPTIPYDE